MAKKIKGPQIILANRLDDGRAVFFTPKQNWSYQASDAWLAIDEAAQQQAMEAAMKSDADNTVIGIEFIGASDSENGPVPTHAKHIIQNTGPTVRLDLGYQAEGAGA